MAMGAVVGSRPPRWRPGGCGAGAIHLFVTASPPAAPALGSAALLAACRLSGPAAAAWHIRALLSRLPEPRWARRSRRVLHDSVASLAAPARPRAPLAASPSPPVARSSGEPPPHRHAAAAAAAVSQLSSVPGSSFSSGFWTSVSMGILPSWVCLPWVHR
jgi:hypothetical protein